MQLAEYSEVTSPDFRGDPRHPESWLEHCGELLRELPGRRVFRAEIGGQRVVIKEFTPKRLRRWFRSYAELEMANAAAARERGVPVVEPLARARLRDGRQLLVLREETGARTLKEIVLGGGLAGSLRHDLAQTVGELVACMQNAGLRHRDPHAGNVLVRPDGSVLLADAKDLQPGNYLTPEQRARDLATFALFFLTHANVVDRLLFWGAYGRASGLAPDELEDLRQRVLALVPEAFRRLVGTRTRKVKRTGQPVRIGAFAGLVMGDVAPALLEAIIAQATHLRDGPHVLKRSPTAWTFLAGDDYVAKVYLPKKASRPVRDLLFGSRAERALEAAGALAHRGLATPPIVAVLNDRQRPGRSLLLMRRETEARPLGEVLASLPARERSAVAVRIGRTLRRMHDWGLRHRDLKQTNLLLTPDGKAIRFLDLDGIRQTRHGPLDWERRARDLGNLDGSLLDRHQVPTGLRLRALDAYLDGEQPPGFAPGEFVRLVTRHADAYRARRAAR
ncbi:MAG: lipopolysaccharide kinase InaA family protein [Planctomycetota bacterium]